MSAFSYDSPVQKTRAAGNAADFLSDELAALGLSRGILVCGKSIRSSALFDRVATALGPAVVATFDRVSAHSPIEVCRDLAAIAIEHSADYFFAVGGGSASDTAKVAAVLIAEGDDIERHASRFDPPDRFRPIQLHRPKLPIIAMPTTASAAEVTFGAGVRMPDGQKLVVWDPKLAARLVVLDASAVQDTPWELLSTTAMNGLAHCIEAVYSRLANPISEALALQGAVLLQRSLLALSAGRRDDGTWLDLLTGANLSGLALSNTRVCIHHAICHGLGGIGGLPHGTANSIILPHAMRFNQDAASEQLGRVAAALGAGTEASGAIDAVLAIQRAVGAPTRLRQTSLRRERLPAIAAHTMSERGVFFNPRPIADADAILQILEAAW